MPYPFVAMQAAHFSLLASFVTTRSKPFKNSTLGEDFR